jgi:hypothetical protein
MIFPSRGTLRRKLKLTSAKTTPRFVVLHSGPRDNNLREKTAYHGPAASAISHHQAICRQWTPQTRALVEDDGLTSWALVIKGGTQAATQLITQSLSRLQASFRTCISSSSQPFYPHLPILKMQFSKIASVAILFVLSFLGLAMASPVARSTEADVKAIITSLKTTIAPNIANISEL